MEEEKTSGEQEKSNQSARDERAEEVDEADKGEKEREMDIGKNDDMQELKQWCVFHWHKTLKKSIENYNPIIYHDCCFSFSRRGFFKTAGHPSLESASVLKIPTLRHISSADEFHRWVLEKAKARLQQGRRSIFPEINKRHREEESEDDEDEVSRLLKRCKELGENYTAALRKIDELIRDNTRLQAACKHWCQKYHDAVLQQEDDQDGNLMLEEENSKLFSSQHEGDLLLYDLFPFSVHGAGCPLASMLSAGMISTRCVAVASVKVFGWRLLGALR